MSDYTLLLLHDFQAARYAQLASGSIIIYDYLVTFSDEVDLIWKSSWSIGKCMFFANRYYVLLSVIINNYGLFSSHLTPSFCLHFFRWQGWTGLIACMMAQIILQMRLYALYYLDKRILILLGVSFIMTSAASAAIMGFVLSRIIAFPLRLTSNMTSCAPIGVYDRFFAFWIPILCFECLLCTLALLRGFQTFKSSNSPFHSGRYLVSVLIRDSILYFLAMFATYLTNLLVWIVARQSLLEIPIGFSVALSCVLGNRLMFNVREANRDRERSKAASRKIGPLGETTGRARSIVLSGAGTLTDFEMSQLRSMRAEP